MENKHLSILLRSDGFSFCILNRHTKEIVHLEHIELNSTISSPQHQLKELEKLFTQNKELNQPFSSVSAIHCNNLSTFVPNPFFKEESLKEYLQYTVKVLPNDFITFDAIESADIKNVYIPFVNFNNFLFDQFGSFEFKHSSSVLIEGLLTKSPHSKEPQFFVNVEKDFFQIVVIQNKKLMFYNAFNYKTKEDFIYYILFTAEQLQLNPEDFKLTFLGEIERESELFDIVYTYVRHVAFYNESTTSNSISQNSDHSNFILLNQYS